MNAKRIAVFACFFVIFASDFADLGILPEADARPRTRRRSYSRGRSSAAQRYRAASARRAQARRAQSYRRSSPAQRYRSASARRAQVRRGRSYGRGRVSPAQRYRSAYARQAQSYRNLINQQTAAKQQFLASNRYVTAYRDYQFVVSDDAQIRAMQAPSTFGPDGKPQEPSPEELSKLRGDSKLVGYPIEFDALQVGQWVRVTLAQQRPNAQNNVTWVAAGNGVGQISSIGSKQITVRVAYQTWVDVKKANQPTILKVPVQDREARIVVVLKQGSTPTPSGPGTGKPSTDTNPFGTFPPK